MNCSAEILVKSSLKPMTTISSTPIPSSTSRLTPNGMISLGAAVG